MGLYGGCRTTPRSSLGGRKKIRARHTLRYLVVAKEEMKYVVCGYQKWGLLNGYKQDRCCVCGREVTVNPLFEDVKLKYCMWCNPQLPELMNEEIDDEHGREMC